MSDGNMGISQLECLQLRNLVGPAGIGGWSNQEVGDTHGTVNVANIPLTYLPDGSTLGEYRSTLTIPSGTGIMRVQIQMQLGGGAPYYYNVYGGDIVSTSSMPLYNDARAEGFAGYYYQGLMMYSNPTSSPAPITLTVGAQSTTGSCELLFFSVNCISFGPYVAQ